METKIEIRLLFETLLSSPGMNEVFKLDLRLSRQTALLLASAVQAGINSSSGSGSLLAFAGEHASGALSEVVESILEKAGLTQTSQKLASLS